MPGLFKEASVVGAERVPGRLAQSKVKGEAEARPSWPCRPT